MQYAKQTNVSSDKSRNEIEQTLLKYGADQFMYGWDTQNALIAFRMKGRQIRFALPMPDKQDMAFTQTDTGRDRAQSAALKAWEQACRQRWRALALVVKAKLEAVETGISEFQDEFMANIVLPNGNTVSQFLTPQLEAAYQSGEMPALLPYKIKEDE